MATSSVVSITRQEYVVNSSVKKYYWAVTTDDKRQYSYVIKDAHAARNAASENPEHANILNALADYIEIHYPEINKSEEDK